ncbi:Aldedh domain-containing protein [Lachancea thermotolerans]|uniref:KLTH0G06292p n=1 Tax=Lachancea thermotolerans (strain ATCC 56472 / CBS 6340 / NRRL Y-8284) TaxID=559295 RepID=C5DM63_LACTC|nr:KLTH0G06292p [Lachancea thermotolerans CBS 6340]CAR24874.1 KLTH0G06292p [Lachancea thermotolerans CBS 6340]
MSQIYLNSSMLRQLNHTVQAYFSDWIKMQQLTFNHTKLANSQAAMKTNSTTFLVTLLVAFVLYRWLFPACQRVRQKPAKFELPLPEAAQKNWKGKRLFPASLSNSESPNRIQCYCPATGQYLGSYPSMTEQDIDTLVSKATKAQLKWRETSFEERIRVLLSLQEYIIENQDSIARVACRDSGKTMLDASMGEILVTLEKLQWIIKNGQSALQPSKRSGPSNFFMKWYKGAEVRYEPLGVVGALVSWNYPFHNLLGPIIAAIFTGNAIVIKCSEQVVWSSEFFAALCRKCLEANGFDPDIIQLCYCSPPSATDDAANYYSSHPGLKHLTFIGSKPVAHHVLTAAAKSLTPVVVELGGKDALIALDSVKDINALSSIIMRGTFQSSGQNCIGIERVIVSAQNYDKLVSLLEQRVGQLRLGSDIDNLEDVDMGAMISDNRFEQLENMIKDAVAKGARLLHGGSRYTHPNYPQGHYFQPTLLVDVTPNMEIAQNEVFGPILTVMRASDTNDCIRLANSAPFGLGGSVFGNDYAECNYVANHLNTGNVAINDFATFYVCQLPFGGINGSGYGKFGGEEGLTGLCNAKSVCYDKLPFISTQIPKPLDYPIKSNASAWNFVKSLNTGAYTTSTWKRIKSVISLAKEA